MFVNLILKLLLYFAGLTGLFVMCLKCPTDSARLRFLLLILAQLYFSENYHVLPLHIVLFSINLAAVSVEQQKYAKIGQFCYIIGPLCSI